MRKPRAKAPDCWQDEKNATKRTEWLKKAARRIETNDVGVDSAPEEVLTAMNESHNYAEEDANDFNIPTLIKYGENWSSDEDSLVLPPPLLNRNNSDEGTCSEASMELKRRTKVRRSMPVLPHGKTWGSMHESEKEFDALESSTEDQPHGHENTNWEFLVCGKVKEAAHA